MPQNLFDSHVVEIAPEAVRSTCVCFDPENVRLEGNYADQISAYRARRIWAETLERCFLLDQGHDFDVRVVSDLARARFTLRCSFTTACARYAFWRLTNQQAPEAQYLIETAHIPRCESHHDEFVAAPDLHSINESETIPLVEHPISERGNLRGTVRQLLDRLMQKFT